MQTLLLPLSNTHIHYPTPTPTHTHTLSPSLTPKHSSTLSLTHSLPLSLPLGRNCTQLLSAHTGAVTALSFSVSNGLLASGGNDATINLFTIALTVSTGTLLLYIYFFVHLIFDTVFLIFFICFFLNFVIDFFDHSLLFGCSCYLLSIFH